MSYLASLLTFPLFWTSSTIKLFKHDTKNEQEWGKGKGVGEPGKVREVTEGFCRLFFFFLSKKNSELSKKETLTRVVWYSKRMHFCFAAKFTEFPRNVTATEGQNVEMSCAFQSGSASVYLEIQWWFLRGPEDLEPGAEVAGAQVAESRRPQRPVRLSHSLP